MSGHSKPRFLKLVFEFQKPTIMNKLYYGRSPALTLTILMGSAATTAARDHYWIGGTGNWNDGSNWSLTSGGNACSCIPDSSNNVFFDGNSFVEVLTVDGRSEMFRVVKE